MRSEDLALNISFSAIDALRLAWHLGELRLKAEYLAWGEEQEEYPDDDLIEDGSEVLSLLQELVEDLKKLKLEEEIQKASLRKCGPTTVVKEEETDATEQSSREDDQPSRGDVGNTPVQ